MVWCCICAIRMRLQSCSHTFIQTYCVFPEQQLSPGDSIVTKDDTSLVSRMYLLTDSLLFHGINCSNPSFMTLSLFHERIWSVPFCQGKCVYLAILIEVIHYLKWTVVVFEGYCVYLRKAVAALLLKVVVFFDRISCNSFCLKTIVLN